MARARVSSVELPELLELVRPLAENWVLPVVEALREEASNPFAVLVTSLISLRTREEQTAPAARSLLSRANTPEAMLLLGEGEIARILHSVGFFRNKARTILDISQRLVDECGSCVPETLEGLLQFKGVGRKTANLVVSVAYGKPAICVDTHVHRISNRIGYVETANPDATELALREKLPRQYWREVNPLLVAFGREMCQPLSPHCSSCPIAPRCPRHGVKRAR